MGARKQHLRKVLKVRQMYPETVSADGTEQLLLSDGSSVLLRTRNDIQQDTEELVVAQAPDISLHQRRGKGYRDMMGVQQSLLDLEVSRGILWRGERGDQHIL